MNRSSALLALVVLAAAALGAAWWLASGPGSAAVARPLAASGGRTAAAPRAGPSGGVARADGGGNPGGAPEHEPVDVPAAARRSPEAAAEVGEELSPRIAGRVLDFATRQPVPDVEVAVVAAGSRTDTTTDEHGAFTSERSELFRSVDVTPRKHEWVGRTERFDSGFRALEVFVVRAAVAAGTVTDAAGSPLAGATVRIAAGGMATASTAYGPDAPDDGLAPFRDALATRRFVRTSTDGRGAFRLSPLGWREEVVLEVTTTGWSAERVIRTGGPGEVVSVDFRPGTESAVTGALSLNGERIAGAIRWSSARTEGTARADSDGRYRIELAEAGELDLWAHPDPMPRRRVVVPGQHVRLVLVEGTEQRHDFDLVFHGDRITGVVRTSAGEPVEGAVVIAHGPSDEASVRTDARGAFGVELVAADALEVFTVELHHGRTRYAREGVALGDVVRFEVPPLARLRYRAVDAGTGEPVEASVSWRRSAGEPFEALRGEPTPPEGADPFGWRTAELIGGPLDLSASASPSGYRATELRGLVLGPAGLDAEIPLERGAELVLELIADLALLREHRIYLVPAELYDEVVPVPSEPGRTDWRCGWSAGNRPPAFLGTHLVYPDGEGIARLAGLSSGPHRFRVHPADVAFTPATIDVGATAGRVRVDVVRAP